MKNLIVLVIFASAFASCHKPTVTCGHDYTRKGKTAKTDFVPYKHGKKERRKEHITQADDDATVPK